MFQGFSLPKKGLTPSQKAKIEMETQISRDKVTNPYKYDPTAAPRGKCPVCATGLPGCPRCFMFPKWPNGVSTTPEDFAFNPERDRLERLAAERRALRETLKNKKKEEKKKMKAEEKRKKKEEYRKQKLAKVSILVYPLSDTSLITP